jgi:hypothetical protein
MRFISYFIEIHPPPLHPPLSQCECETMQLFGRGRDVAIFIAKFELMALRNVISAEQKPLSWC